MQCGRVIGKAISTIKHDSLRGAKLLVVQPQDASGAADGHPMIAIDAVGAGVGQTVMLTSDGRFARDLLSCQRAPVRWSIIGIRDD